MKCTLLVLIALAAIVAADEEWKPASTDAEMDVFHKECVKETLLTKEQIEQVEKFKFPDEKGIHQFSLCMVKKMGIFSEDSGFNRDRLSRQIDTIASERRALPENIKPGLMNCLDITVDHADAGERVYRELKCMSDYIDKLKAEKKQNQE